MRSRGASGSSEREDRLMEREQRRMEREEHLMERSQRERDRRVGEDRAYDLRIDYLDLGDRLWFLRDEV